MLNENSHSDAYIAKQIRKSEDAVERAKDIALSITERGEPVQDAASQPPVYLTNSAYGRLSKQRARNNFLDKYVPNRVCPSCGQTKANSRSWVIAKKYGSVCRQCHWTLELVIPRRRLWINYLLKSSELPSPYDTYAGSPLVDSIGRLNPLGLACQVAAAPTDGSSPVCTVASNGVRVGNTRYATGALPDQVAEWFRLRTPTGRFGDDGDAPDNYISLAKMCEDRQPFLYVAEALRAPSLWAVKPAPSIEWWVE